LTLYNGENLILYENEKIVPYSEIFEEKYKNITKKQIDDVIRKYFKKQNMTFCFIGEKINDMEIIKQECEKLSQ
jgi:predicted Zn-dependent peptidase